MSHPQLHIFLASHSNEIKTLMYTTFIYLNIDIDIVQVLIWLMIIDTFSGVLKTFILNKEFEFKFLFFGLCSKLLVLLIPMVVALVGRGISKEYDFLFLLNVVLKILVVSEGLSVITNLYIIKTKKELKSFDIITMLLNMIRHTMIRFIKSLFIDIDKKEK